MCLPGRFEQRFGRSPGTQLFLGFLHTQTVIIVLERYARALCAHLLQLAAGLPRVRPRPIIGQVANRVVGDRLAVVRCQFILPVAVAVDVRNRLNRRSDCARGVSIPRFAQNVSAAVVVVHPGLVLMQIVYTDQLAQRVVLIRRGQIAALLGDDVPAAIIFIFKRDAILSNLLHQRRGAVRTITAIHIFVGARQLAGVCASQRDAFINPLTIVMPIWKTSISAS